MNEIDISQGLEHFIIVFLLIFARMAGFVSRAPAFSELQIPALAKSVIIFAFSLFSLSYIDISTVYIEDSNIHLLVALIINFLFGHLIGFIGNLVVHIAQVAGEVVDVQAGLSSSVIVTGGVQATLFSTAFKSLVILIFFYFGGLEILLQSLKMSFAVMPLDSFDFSHIGLTMADMIRFTGNVVVIGIATASPILVGIVFMDVILGLMSRAAQQINPFQLSFSLKPLVSIVLLMFILPLMNAKFITLFESGANIFRIDNLSDQPRTELEQARKKYMQEEILYNNQSE